jgi:hypothetical protein
LQRRRLEAFDLDDNLAAARRPDAEMDATIGLRLGADRQAPDGRCSARNQMFRAGGLARCRKLMSFLREADARAHTDARVHAATSRAPYEPRQCAGACVTVPAVILSFCSISDGTRSGSFIVVVADGTTLRMAAAI